MIVSYKTVIFDFDGTLANSLEAIVLVVRQLAKEFRQEQLLKTPIRQLRHKTALELINQFKIPFYRLPFLLNKGRQLLAKETDQIKLYPGIKLLIESLLKHHLEIGILSSNSKSIIKKVLGRYKL